MFCAQNLFFPFIPNHPECRAIEETEMKERLRTLFDYQKFMRNDALQELISDVESRYAEPSSVRLSDADLSFAVAAGDPGIDTRDSSSKHLGVNKRT